MPKWHWKYISSNKIKAFQWICFQVVYGLYCVCVVCAVHFMPYYGLFWTRSPHLDLRWRSRSTGTILELFIASIVRHKNKNRWVGDPLWRSCSLLLILWIREISLHKTIDMISTGDPPLTCSCYNGTHEKYKYTSTTWPINISIIGANLLDYILLWLYLSIREPSFDFMDV